MTSRLVPLQACAFCLAALGAASAEAANLKVMKTGLGSGTVVTTTGPEINCGVDCDESFGGTPSVTLRATADAGSTFVGWFRDADGDSATTPDCTGTGDCVLPMTADRSVRPVFDLATPIPTLTSFTPAGIQAFLIGNPSVNTPARFVAALPAEYRQNWLLMVRSESLQTGTARMPRVLLPNANAQAVFTLGLSPSASYPGTHPNAIEYMQWDATEKNFRFHEIVLDAIPMMGTTPARTRGVTVDDARCSRCHSTRNVLNLSTCAGVTGTCAGTTGITPGTVKYKNKPNWDSYDSWAGQLGFNRDRIYQGSVEAAAFRKLLNPWTWRADPGSRAIMEQLQLQPAGVPTEDVISRIRGGANDGHIKFAFDSSPPVLTEPAPTGSVAAITSNYNFDGAAGSGSATTVQRGGPYVLLRHTTGVAGSGPGVEGRGVQLFDLLGGADGTLNAQRIADELIDHRWATGNVHIDPRPTALAILRASSCLAIDTTGNQVTSATSLPALTVNLSFFDGRNGMRINELVNDTRSRAQSLTRRKADFQKRDLDRTGDNYMLLSSPENGLIAEYGAATSQGTSIGMDRLRQDVFRRNIDLGVADGTVMGGIYVDRELYAINTNKIALLRYFLEPLGISIDKWSMGVRGRSRTYTFADVFGSYQNVLEPALRTSLTSNPVGGITDPNDCSQLINAMNTTLGSLPGVNDVPTYTDVQRIFNKSCIECHGGLGYPPYANYGSTFDLSENETPPTSQDRLDRSLNRLLAGFVGTGSSSSFLYDKITRTTENCPSGVMPCGGPPLSKADVETIRRWLDGGTPNTRGDPHIETVDGVAYDFQAAGEYVLLTGGGVDIQARQTAVTTNGGLGPNAHTGLTSCVSINTAAAVGVDGHKVTYQPGVGQERGPGNLELRIDGKLVELGAAGARLGPRGRVLRTAAEGGVQIRAGGTVVVLTPGFWHYYRVWYLNIDVQHARGTEGMMGAIAPGNWLPAMPDGTQLGPRPEGLQQRYGMLYGRLGNAWRVTDATSLFDYAAGQSPATYYVTSWPNGESPQSCVAPPLSPATPKLPPAPLTRAAAEQHCKPLVDDNARDNCIMDVMVTGEPKFAQTYLQGERIARLVVPGAPSLASPADFAAGLKAPVNFTWSTSPAPDGGELTTQHCVWDVRTEFTLDACSPLPGVASGTRCALWVLLIGLLVLLLLYFLGLRRRRGVLLLLLLLLLLGAWWAYRSCGSASGSHTVGGLDAGKDYYWKVIVEDKNGTIVESVVRRFEVR